MIDATLDKKICALTRADRRYTRDAYYFILEALDFITSKLGRNRLEGPDRHISVDELLEGTRCFALDQFGPLARVVLEHFGIRSTRDIGEVVFHLVEVDLLNKQDSDRMQDFVHGFDFKEAFEETYQPDVPW